MQFQQDIWRPFKQISVQQQSQGSLSVVSGHEMLLAQLMYIFYISFYQSGFISHAKQVTVLLPICSVWLSLCRFGVATLRSWRQKTAKKQQQKLTTPATNVKGMHNGYVSFLSVCFKYAINFMVAIVLSSSYASPFGRVRSANKRDKSCVIS